MKNRFIPVAGLRPALVLSALLLVSGCNTATAPVRSGGSPGASSAGGPSVTVNSPGGSSVGDPSVTVSGPGLPVPPTAGIPAPGAAGGTTGVDARQGGLTPPTPGRATPAGRPDADNETTTGAGQARSDDEILAEALAELGNRPAATDATNGEPANDAGRGPTQAAPGATPPGNTRQARLDGELQSEFARFDQLILDEQEAISKRAGEDGYGPPTGEDNGMASAMPAGQQAEPPTQTAMLDNDPANVKPGERPGTRDHSRVPPDLADASGDDIIARQLREAAMKEEDPELREKLWVEYRKYKREMR